MSVKLKFENGTVRPRFKLIAEIDEASITTGYADNAKSIVVTEIDDAKSTIQDSENKRAKPVVGQVF